MASHSLITDVNTLATFLAQSQISNLKERSNEKPIDCLVLVGSAVLHCAESVFQALNSSLPGTLTPTLVICGGIGHSTSLLYAAIAGHPVYHRLPQLTPYSKNGSLDGLPEARVLYELGKAYFSLEKLEAKGLRVLIEDQSTNCGANASETRKVLDEAGLDPRTVVVVQDPTMARRTVASFERVYADAPSVVEFVSWPTFVPRVKAANFDEEDIRSEDGVPRFSYDLGNVDGKHLWSEERFLDLLLGEIPRLRDDENGYGPRGKGFIVHVDVSQEVEEAWKRLGAAVGESGRAGR